MVENIEELPIEILHEVISFLSFWERRSLKKSTKTLRNAALGAPLVFSEIVRFMEEDALCWCEVRCPCTVAQVMIHFEDVTIAFNESQNVPNATSMHVSVNSRNYTEKTLEIENSEFRDVARQYLQEIVLRRNVTCDCFGTNYELTKDFLKDAVPLNTRSLWIYESSRPENSAPTDSIANWLKHASSRHLKSVAVYMSYEECSLSDTINQLTNVHTLHVLRRSDIDDNFVMNLRASDIELQPAAITVNGINKIIQKWVNQKVAIGTRFVYYFDDPKEFPLNELIKNVKDSSTISNTRVIIPIAPDRFFQVFVNNSSVSAECLKKK